MVVRAVIAGQTHSHDSNATEFGVAGEPGRTRADWLVRNHIAHGVGSACRRSVAQVLTAIEKAGLLVRTVIISTASDLTSPV